MLLYVKPLSEVEIGESFQVTVTREDWERGGGACEGTVCALAQAVRRDHGCFVAVGPTYAYIGSGGSGHKYGHDGWALVSDFDNRLPFPGEAVVTFVRQAC